MDTIRRLIVRMATENRKWGDTRIRGALGNLGHQVARGTIANVLKERGLEPAPERKTRTTWREFLAAHWDVLAAADFFTVEVWTPRGLTRFTVLVLIHLASRRVQIAGISAEPDGPWVTQLMRNATDAEDGFLRHGDFSWRYPAFTINPDWTAFSVSKIPSITFFLPPNNASGPPACRLLKGGS